MHLSLKKFLKKEKELVKDIEKELSSRHLKGFLLLFTELGSSLTASIFLVIYGFLFDFKAMIFIASIYYFQLIIVELIKLLVKRQRPENHEANGVLKLKFTSGSFPSGHTSNVFTLAFLFSNYYLLGIIPTTILFSLAGLVALSRIVLGKHYIGDVTGGAIIGILLSFAGATIATQLAPFLSF